jgi:hypothetical protein
MEIRKCILPFFLAGALITLGCGGSESATESEGAITPGSVKINDKSVKVGPIDVRTTENGSSVSLPGININSDKNGKSTVTMPGLKVDATDDGNAKVNLGGLNVNVSNDGESSKVDVGGTEIRSKNDDANVDVQGIKINRQGNEKNIELPGGIKIQKNGNIKSIQLPGMNIQKDD